MSKREKKIGLGLKMKHKVDKADKQFDSEIQRTYIWRVAADSVRWHVRHPVELLVLLGQVLQ